MIKYFQKLKAKKGFTLVELIVVIAIIGVLAAILIPTMLGYVTQSKVTSANSTAASIKNEIDAFLTNLDTVDKGMKKGSMKAVIVLTAATATDKVTTWTCTVSDQGNTKATSSFNDYDNWSGGANTATSSDATTVTKGSTSHRQALAADIRDLFPEIKDGAIAAYLQGGKCVGVQYTNGTTNLLSADALGAWAGTWPTGCKWSNGTAGVTASGDIIGTAPVIPLSDSGIESTTAAAATTAQKVASGS